MSSPADLMVCLCGERERGDVDGGDAVKDRDEPRHE